MGKKKESPVQSPQQTKPSHKGDPGPQESRQCRDIFFFLLFIGFWIGMLAIAGVAIKQGDINRLRYGFDSWNNTCGTLNPAVEDFPAFDARNLKYVYYLNEFTLLDTPKKICVERCPDRNTTTGYNWVCTYGVDPPTDDNVAWAKFVMGNSSCWPVLFSTKNVLNRCMPSNASEITDYLNKNSNNSTNDTQSTSEKVYNFVSNDLNGRSNMSKIYESLADTWEVILGMAFVALAVSFLWLVLVNFFGGLVVWTTVGLVNVITGALAIFLLYNWHQSRTDQKFIQTGNARIDSQLYNEKTLLVLGVISSVIFGLIFLVSCAARSRIRLAIQVIKETSKAIRAMPFIILFPVFKYILIGLLFAWFVFIYALLGTSGNISKTVISKVENSTDNATIQKYFNPSPEGVTQFLQIYYIFGLFWTWNWILAIWQCTIAGAIATWYWTREKNNLPRLVVWKSFYRCFRYHLGSLAFGSLLIATVQIIRYFLMKAQTHLSKSDNKVAKYILTCLQCVFACLERFLKFLNKNAYIEIAVYGYSFLTAAKTAFELLIRNAFRVVVVDKVGNFLLFLGKLLITVVTSLIGLIILQRTHSELGNFYAVPLIFIAVESWLIASFFMTVVDMAIDTIFLCFCEDSERHDGTALKPYYASESLRQFMEKHKAAGAPDIGGK